MSDRPTRFSVTSGTRSIVLVGSEEFVSAQIEAFREPIRLLIEGKQNPAPGGGAQGGSKDDHNDDDVGGTALEGDATDYSGLFALHDNEVRILKSPSGSKAARTVD